MGSSNATKNCPSDEFDDRSTHSCKNLSGESVIGDSDDNEPSFLVWRRLHLSRAKLKGVTEMAALMAGFSVVATVELQIKDQTSELLLTAFASVTALLVTTTMLSIMISTCILPHLEAVSKLNSTTLVKQSPHDALVKYVDLSWVLANSLSIFLFLVDVILLCWIKFNDKIEVCIAFTSVMVPVLLLLFVFSVVFYRQSVQHQYVILNRKYEELEHINHLLNHPTSNHTSRAHSFQSLQNV